MRDFDVLIVGLGPTGATLAGLLGQRDLKVAVFDRLPGLYPLPRALGLDHETMRIMQELGIVDQVSPHVAPYKTSIYLGMDGEPIKQLDAMPGAQKLGWFPNYVFDQPAFEHTIRQRLSELANVQLHFPAEVVNSGQDDKNAWIDVKHEKAADTIRYTGRYLIACDGGSSAIRKRLGLTLEDLDFDEPWLVVDAIVNDDKLEELPTTNIQYCEAQRPATFVVGPGKHRRWEIMLQKGDSLASEFPEEQLWPLLSRWLKPGEAKLWRAAAYRFHGLLARSWRDGRILLAGDAAHMTPPFLAQGMVSGIRDAHNLAWKLERVIKEKSSDELLNSYETERKPHVRETILAAMRLGRLICERDNERAGQRDRQLREQQGGTIRTEYRQNMIPNLEAGLIDSIHAGAGDILPQPKVTSNGFNGLLDDLTGCGFRLVVRDKLDEAQRADYLGEMKKIGGVLVELGSDVLCHESKQAIEQDPLVNEWMDSIGAVAVIARPDHYIYSTANTHEEAVSQLRQLADMLA